VVPHAVPRFKEKLAEFLRVTPDVPDSLQELQDQAGIRLLIGDELRCNPPITSRALGSDHAIRLHIR
jgi:hypothetical protein